MTETHSSDTEPFPSQAHVVVIGGGVIGCSVAYHLTKLGERHVSPMRHLPWTSNTAIMYTSWFNQALRSKATISRLRAT